MQSQADTPPWPAGLVEAYPSLASLPDELRAKLQKVSVDAYRALRVRDYGRVDLRLTDTGDIVHIDHETIEIETGTPAVEPAQTDALTEALTK